MSTGILKRVKKTLQDFKHLLAYRGVGGRGAVQPILCGFRRLRGREQITLACLLRRNATRRNGASLSASEPRSLCAQPLTRLSLHTEPSPSGELCPERTPAGFSTL